MESPQPGNTASPLPYNKQRFVETIGQTYTFHPEEGKTIQLTLRVVKDSQHVDERFERFSLFFTAPEDEPAVMDNSFQFTNETLGSLKIFISACPTFENGKSGYEYESVFNIVKETPTNPSK